MSQYTEISRDIGGTLYESDDIDSDVIARFGPGLIPSMLGPRVPTVHLIRCNSGSDVIYHQRTGVQPKSYDCGRDGEEVVAEIIDKLAFDIDFDHIEQKSISVEFEGDKERIENIKQKMDSKSKDFIELSYTD